MLKQCFSEATKNLVVRPQRHYLPPPLKLGGHIFLEKLSVPPRIRYIIYLTLSFYLFITLAQSFFLSPAIIYYDTLFYYNLILFFFRKKCWGFSLSLLPHICFKTFSITVVFNRKYSIKLIFFDCECYELLIGDRVAVQNPRHYMSFFLSVLDFKTNKENQHLVRSKPL